MIKPISAISTRATSRRQVVCMCDARKKYETKIANRVKENMNHLMILGAADFNMMYDLLKEADLFHREKVNDMMDSMKSMKSMNIDDSTKEDTIDENIFLDKN